MLQDGKTLVLSNPAAKRGECAKAAYHVRRLLREALGVQAVDEAQTGRPGDGVYLAAGACGAYENIVVVGGDGIIHEAANGLMSLPAQDRPALGIVPMGSGNDYARTLGMSEDIEEAVSQLLGLQALPTDVGKVNDEYFVETLSFGLDAAIALDTMERRLRSQKSGTALYFEAGINQLLHHLDERHVRAVLDGGRSIDAKTITFAVQIGPTYGGGFCICPDADPADGLLDICYAQAPWSVPRAVFTFARAKDGKHVGARGIYFEQAETLQLRFDTAPPAQADGERVEGTEFDIGISKHAIRVYRNAWEG